MNISVRPVCLEREHQEFLNILQANLPALDHARRFQWLYRDNPDGPAWSWFVIERTSNQIVGVTSVVPHAMWTGTKTRICGQVGDFAVSAKHRSLGPALLLQRATFEPVDQGKLALCYDCPPHAAGMSTFRRLGMQANCRVDRYALPLRIDARIRKRFGSTFASPARLGNLLLRLHRWPAMRSGMRGLEVSDYTGAFGEEFSWLDSRVKAKSVIRGQRSAAHLNWRYRADPLRGYHVLTARRDGELVAFVVLCLTGDIVTIVDLFGVELQETAVALLRAVVDRFEKSHQTIEAFLSPDNSLINHFLHMKFSLRSEAARVVAYAKPQTEVAEFLHQSPNWSFSQSEIRA
jgi:hypothetical protein